MTDAIDPKGLIRDALLIEGISLSECRSIFFDWALSLPDGADNKQAIQAVLKRHDTAPPEHPIIQTLQDGLAAPTVTGRRGGRAARLSR